MNILRNKVLRSALMAGLLAVTRDALAQNNTPAAPPPAPPQAQGPTPVPVQVQPVQPQADWVTKIIELKYADANQMKSILSIFRADLVVPGVMELYSGRPRIISVHAPKEIMAAIEDTIARFDVPPPPQPVRAPAAPVKSIEVSVQVLGTYDGTAPVCPNCAIPPSLQPVITQLQKTFAYKNYLLLDSQLYRHADGRSLSGTNSLAAMNDSSATYSVSWNSAIASPDKASVQLNSLKFGADVSFPGSHGSTHFGFETQQVQIPADQQIVIGKTTVGVTAVFLVIRAKVLD
jgi:hypothetical protein